VTIASPSTASAVTRLQTLPSRVAVELQHQIDGNTPLLEEHRHGLHVVADADQPAERASDQESRACACGAPCLSVNEMATDARTNDGLDPSPNVCRVGAWCPIEACDLVPAALMHSNHLQLAV
jgi:hypothetical protein